MITGPIDIFDLRKNKEEEIYGQITIGSCNNGLDKELNPPNKQKKNSKGSKELIVII